MANGLILGWLVVTGALLGLLVTVTAAQHVLALLRRLLSTNAQAPAAVQDNRTSDLLTAA